MGVADFVGVGHWVACGAVPDDFHLIDGYHRLRVEGEQFFESLRELHGLILSDIEVLLNHHIDAFFDVFFGWQHLNHR